MGLATLMAPQIAETIFPLLASSAVAAGNHCAGGSTGTMCNPYWTVEFNDTFTPAVGAQMTALNVFNANLLNPVFNVTAGSSIVTTDSGGTSPGNPDAGSNIEAVPGYISSANTL